MNQTPLKQLMESTLRHYDELSQIALHWNSIVPVAIRKYYERGVVEMALDMAGNYGSKWVDHVSSIDVEFFYNTASEEEKNTLGQIISDFND